MICVIEASAFVAVLLSEPERAALIRATKGADLVAPEVDLTRSLKLAAERGIYAYDAYLLTCAKQHRAPLLTLDTALSRTATAIGIHHVALVP